MTTRVMQEASVRSVIVLTAGLGGGALLAFGVFLFAGPPGLVELNLGLQGELAVNTSLSLVFFVQHSGMIRRPFKAWLARYVPDYFVAAFFSIASGLALILVVFVWQESSYVIARATGALRWTIYAVFLLAFGGLVWGAVALGGFDTLGLKPIRDRFKNRDQRSTELIIRGPYRWVRHPLYLFVILMIWAYPQLTIDRLLFNVLWTVWIAMGAWLEERDLVMEFGDQYRAYQQRVPMLIPCRISGSSTPT